MRKDKNSFSKIFFRAVIPVVASLFIYVFVLQEIKTLGKERTEKEEILLEKINKANARLVTVQQFSAEARITKIAKDSLGLIRKGEEFDRISVDGYKIEQIKKIVNEKYE